MISLKQEDGVFLIFCDGRRTGAAELYDDPLHMRNAYVRLRAEGLAPKDAPELFALLRQTAERPLQVMTDSENVELVQLLAAGGFRCLRKCYEMEVSAEDYIGSRGQEALHWCTAGSSEYARCGALLYEHYKATHADINPWTADFAAFCTNLPETAAYLSEKEDIRAACFVEGDELAYLCGKDTASLRSFAESLIPMLFESHETLCFEWDDCDWAAMALKSLFSVPCDSSFDTYIYE